MTEPLLSCGVAAGSSAHAVEAFDYFAFGLRIRSELRLPELVAAQFDHADLEIVVGSTGRPFPVRADGVRFDFAAPLYYLGWPEVAAFLIEGTGRITVEPAPEVEPKLLPFPLLGPVMALLLHLRHMLVLHASAVEIGDGSATFLGDKGAGKSTTAAAFVQAGHRLVTDDLLAITFDDPRAPLVEPGFPQLKLSAEAGAALPIAGAERLPLVFPDFEKNQFRLDQSGVANRVAPSRIYVLERGGDKATISRLGQSDALAAVMRFSYVARFGPAAMTDGWAAVHFRQCAALTSSAAVSRLQVPADLTRLAEMLALVEADAGG